MLFEKTFHLRRRSFIVGQEQPACKPENLFLAAGGVPGQRIPGSPKKHPYNVYMDIPVHAFLSTLDCLRNFSSASR
jgi:hypothetical protein